jgi:transcriptional regulator with XRE-family HTH domain
VDSKKQTEESPPPYPRRRGRTPKPTSHPLGRLIRERRLAKGLSLAQLAEAVGIGPTSVSLIAAMEHGSIPPRRDVAERLAAVLELVREPLLMWADTRMSPRASWIALQEREDLETLFTKLDVHGNEAAGLDSDPGRWIWRALRDPTWSPSLAPGQSLAGADAAAELPKQIPILPAGADPDRYRRRPRGYLDREVIERLIGGRAELVRPLAYELGDDDFERLRRVAHPHGRPLHALVSRSTPVDIDPREPYAIRFEGGVILAYCAWDGRELVVLQAPGHVGFARLKARSQAALSGHVVGQVVTLNWWEPSDVQSPSVNKTAT